MRMVLLLFILGLPLAACDGQKQEATHRSDLTAQKGAETESEKHEEHDDHDHKVDHGGHEDIGGLADKEGHEGEDDSHEQVAESGHDEHGHDEHGSVNLSAESRDAFGVTTAIVGAADLNIYITLPGEISVNEDRLAHVVPRVGGVVTEALKSWGDPVKLGEPIAILDSQELGGMNAAYLSSVERRSLAKSVFEREKRLWEKKITSEQEYLNAKQGYADADITYREKRQALLSLGISEERLKKIAASKKESLTRHEIIAPFGGVVIDKHLTLGEAVEANSAIYQIGDLSEVWANLSVYQKDLGKVRKGALALVSGPDGEPEGMGAVTYVRPIIGEQTRTALARIPLDNEFGQWRPGLFVEAMVAVDSFTVPIAVHTSAVQKKEGMSVVFVETLDGDLFPQVVETGRSDGVSVEIVKGLQVGATYVSKGSFVVKAESEKESFGGDGHNH